MDLGTDPAATPGSLWITLQGSYGSHRISSSTVPSGLQKRRGAVVSSKGEGWFFPVKCLDAALSVYEVLKTSGWKICCIRSHCIYCHLQSNTLKIQIIGAADGNALVVVDGFITSIHNAAPVAPGELDWESLPVSGVTFGASHHQSRHWGT